jgi:hypothetical protein
MSTPSTFTIPNIPEVPETLLKHQKPLVRKLAMVASLNVEEARESAQIIGRYLAGEAQAQEVLRTSEKTKAVEFRKARSEMIDKIKALREQFEKDIAPYKEALDASIKDEQTVVHEIEVQALVENAVDTGVTLKEKMAALENYEAAAEMVAMTVAKMKKNGVETSFTLPSITAKKGKTGETRGFTPRFDKVVINGTELTIGEGKSPKLMDIVNRIGVASIDRAWILKQLPIKEQWEQLAPGDDVTFTVTWTNEDDASKSLSYDITVTKALPAVRAKKNADGSLTEAPDDDDEDDEDDEDNE